MNKKLHVIFCFVAIAVLFGCSTIPIIGRKQMALLPESSMVAQGDTSYREVISSSVLSKEQTKVQMLQRVGNNIASAVDEYFSQNNMKERAAMFDWEFNLISDDTPNAWCMPGGKVAFYTGILPYTKDEAGMAVVMGHEIAHAVARHGNERLTMQLGVQLASALLAKGLEDEENKEAYLMAVGLGAQYGLMLPYSRKHEYEADRLGLIFMAMAGYDPSASVSFWRRMAAANKQSPIELFSTHPSDENRIQKLQELIPEAMSYYRK